MVGVFFPRRSCRRNILLDLGLGRRALSFQFPHPNASMPPTSPGPTFCPVRKEDLGSVAALGAHYNSFHASRDNRLVTKPSLQCSRCELVFHSKWRLRNRSCSSVSVRQVGSIASTVKKPQPAQWLIATDASASPSSVEQPASGGWGFVVDRIGCLSGVEVEYWGEVLTDDRDPRALGADSLTNNSAELWALAEAFLCLCGESGDDNSVSVTFALKILRWPRASSQNPGHHNRILN